MDFAQSIKSRKYMCQGQPMWCLKYQITSLFAVHSLTYLLTHSCIHSQTHLFTLSIHSLMLATGDEHFQITLSVTVISIVLQCFPFQTYISIEAVSVSCGWSCFLGSSLCQLPRDGLRCHFTVMAVVVSSKSQSFSS